MLFFLASVVAVPERDDALLRDTELVRVALLAEVFRLLKLSVLFVEFLSSGALTFVALIAFLTTGF